MVVRFVALVCVGVLLTHFSQVTPTPCRCSGRRASVVGAGRGSWGGFHEQQRSPWIAPLGYLGRSDRRGPRRPSVRRNDDDPCGPLLLRCVPITDAALGDFPRRSFERQ